MPECSEIYWEKLNEGILYLQQCCSCQRFIFYPRALCPYCLKPDLEWKPVCGKGRVYSYTEVYVSALPEFVDETPYIYAVIELDEGVKMPGMLINCSFEEVKVNMPVEVIIIEKQGRKLPAFKKMSL